MKSKLWQGLGLLIILTLLLSTTGVFAAPDPPIEDGALEAAKAQASPAASGEITTLYTLDDVPYPLFVGVDDATLPTSAYLIDPDTAANVPAFAGAEVWGAAYDDENDRVLFNSGSTLYEWPVGGAVNGLGTITDLSGTLLSLVGLAFYDGTLYASRNIANEAIYTIDLTTLVATVYIDYEDADYDFGGLAADPNTGELYGTNDDTSPHGSGLFRINLDGSATQIAAYPAGQTDIDGLAISDDGFAYLVIDEPGDIFVYDMTAMAYTDPISNPWTTSEVFSGGAWIWESEPASIVLTKTVGTDPLSCATTDEITVPTGTEVTYCYEVENVSDTTFNYHTLDDSELGNLFTDLNVVLAPGATATVTQSTTINVTTVNTATWLVATALPTYTVDDTFNYNWQDISGTGTAVTLADDSVSDPIPMGFDFQYFGREYDEIYISSNGFLSVLEGQGSGCCTGQVIPNAPTPNGVIAGWWEDFSPNSSGTIHYETLGAAPDRVFIVQVTEVPHYPSGNTVTLEYKLFEGSNAIEVHYQAAPSDGGTHSAGIENAGGTVGVQYYRGTDPLSTPLAVRYTPNDIEIDEAMDTATVNVIPPSITLTKTVGTDPMACAATDEITVPPGTDVTYCYEVENTGDITLNLHDLDDSELGNIFSGLNYALLPGEIVYVTQTTTINVTTVNTGTWNAYNVGGPLAQAMDTATVNIIPPTITLTKTVGTDPMACAATDEITVPPGTDVTYCYEVENTGDITLNLHDLDDSELGNIFSGLNYALLPGEIIYVTQTTTIDVTTVNTGTWNAYNDVGPGAQATDVATVTVLAPNIYVDPLSLSSTQPPDTMTDHTLTISNTGEADLNWTILEEPAPVVKSTEGGRAPRVPALEATGSRSAVGETSLPQPYVSLADFTEGFDDITLLPGAGWYFQNNSSPLGVTDWFQGNSTVFPAHQGDPTAYIGANFNNTVGVGTISNWMLTPEISLNNGDTISFWTRGPATSNYPDRLELRLSTAGGSTDVGALATDVGDFTTLLLTVNESLVVGGYPNDWTQFSATLSGIPAGATGRIGFRYYVTEAGPAGNNSDYIGIDTVEYTSGQAPVCDAPADVPWLSTLPVGGTTLPDAGAPVQVTLDSTGLMLGTYEANLCIESNDPDPGPGNETELVVVPVTLIVETPPEASIIITKTVGTVDGVCATTDEITVIEGTTVYYCYEVENTGDITLNVHDLDDTELGNIFTGLNYALTPGSSIDTVAAGLSIPAIINVTTVNTGTWTAYNVEGPVVQATDSARVNVEPSAVTLTALAAKPVGLWGVLALATTLAFGILVSRRK